MSLCIILSIILSHILFNHPVSGILPVISRLPIGINNDEEHYERLVNRQTKDGKNQGTPGIMFLFQD